MTTDHPPDQFVCRRRALCPGEARNRLHVVTYFRSGATPLFWCTGCGMSWDPEGWRDVPGPSAANYARRAWAKTPNYSHGAWTRFFRAAGENYTEENT